VLNGDDRLGAARKEDGGAAGAVFEDAGLRRKAALQEVNGGKRDPRQFVVERISTWLQGATPRALVADGCADGGKRPEAEAEGNPDREEFLERAEVHGVGSPRE
jgi:hypothetical protein